MLLHEAFGLHEHPARPAAGVVYPSVVGLDHRHQQLDHAGRGVELAAALALRAGEAPQEVLVGAAQDVLLLALRVAQADGADQVEQLAQAGLVQVGTGVGFGQDAAQARILPLDGGHRIVNQLAHLRTLGLRLETVPAGLGRHPEDVLGGVFVPVFQDLVPSRRFPNVCRAGRVAQVVLEG